jgi:hypothetical protein
MHTELDLALLSKLGVTAAPAVRAVTGRSYNRANNAPSWEQVDYFLIRLKNRHSRAN